MTKKIQQIKDIVILINRSYTPKTKRNKEFRYLLSYITKSDLYKGDKRKIYSLIKENIK